MCQDSLVGLGAPERTSGEAHYYCIATKVLCYVFARAGDANRAKDDSDLTISVIRRGVWNHFQYSCPI